MTQFFVITVIVLGLAAVIFLRRLPRIGRRGAPRDGKSAFPEWWRKGLLR